MAAIAPERRTLRVLVTGFGPFRDVDTNPSWLAVSPLNGKTLTFTKPPAGPKSRPVEIQVQISALEVPVTYSAVLNTVPPLHASKQYDVILHTGVGHAGGFMVERLAHKTGYDQDDALGRKCDPVGDAEGPLVKRGFGRGYEHIAEELRTGVDVDAIVQHIKSKGLEHTSPSNDPGRYLCDFIYFCSLACAQKEGSKVKVLFMHVPPAGFPYQVDDMTRAATAVLEYFALHA